MSPDFNSRVRDALAKINGTKRFQVALLTGASHEEIATLGGFPEDAARVDTCQVILATGPGFVSQLINANERGHWAKREARRDYWLDLTMYRLRDAPPLYQDRHVHIGITISWPDRKRRDVGNWQPTAKAIVDGIVKAKVITDDSDRYVTGPDLRRAYGPHEIRLTITPTGALP